MAEGAGVIRYLAFVPVSLAFTLLALILAPLLPLFTVSRFGPCDNASDMRVGARLPLWLSWFDTPDNDLSGDGAWRRFEPGHWAFRAKLHNWPILQTYLGAVGWLWRNSAYGFQWNGPISAKLQPGARVKWCGSTLTQNGPRFHPGHCLTVVENVDGSWYWHFYYVRQITATRCVNVNLGWKLKTFAEDPHRLEGATRARFTFSPRVTGFTSPT